jgi:hypothetical protein
MPRVPEVSMAVFQLAYYSRNRIAGDDRALLAGLRQVLSVSQANNGRDGITGYLIFDKTWFVQILEGTSDAVTRTYNRIQSDSRHEGVVTIGQREVRNRSFPQWSMGGSMLTPDKREIYLRHGVGGALDPTKLTRPSIIALAMDLQDYELAQKRGLRAMAG